MTVSDRSTAIGDQLFAAVLGRLTTLEEVPDEMFAEKMLGDGFAVDPTSGTFRAPIAGEIVVLANTLHAYAIRAKTGVEVLVHIGIDTVALNGKGFSTTRRVGEMVEVGDEIIHCDLALVADGVPSMMTPVIVTNGDVFAVTGLNLNAQPGHPVAQLART